MGVWIEIFAGKYNLADDNVTPCMGVWIEIISVFAHPISIRVTPCMGVWIEIFSSLIFYTPLFCHSLYGSVD